MLVISPPVQRQQTVGLRQQGIVTHGGDGNPAVRKGGAIALLQTPQRGGGANHQTGEVHGRGLERNVDLEQPLIRHEGVQRAEGVTDSTDSQMLGTGGKIVKPIASLRVGGDRAVEIRQGHHGVGQTDTTLGVTHHTRD